MVGARSTFSTTVLMRWARTRRMDEQRHPNVLLPQVLPVAIFAVGANPAHGPP